MAYEGTKKVFRFDAMRRTPRVAALVARYIGEPMPDAATMGANGWREGVSGALDLIAEYKMARVREGSAKWMLMTDAERAARVARVTPLRSMLANAVAER